MATRQEEQLWQQFLANQPQGYQPQYYFAAGWENYDQTYAIPTTPYEREAWGNPGYFVGDPNREVTAQGLYTGQVEGAVPIDINNVPPEMRQDYDIWQNRLAVGQAGEDSFNPLGDQFFSALAALGAATGGAAAFGGFAAPGAAATGASFGLEAGVPGTLAASDAIGPILATGGGIGAGGSALPAIAGAAIPAAGAAALPAAAGGGAGVSTLGSLIPLLDAGLGAGSSILGGVLAADAARDAARTQAGAASDANRTLMDIYQQNRADLEPYRQTGYTALGQLAGLAGEPLTLPGAFDPSDSYLDPNAFAFSPQVGRFDQMGFAPQVGRFDQMGFAPQVGRFDQMAPVSAEQYAFRPPSGQQVLEQDPGYQFRLAQGMKALEASAARRGGLLSGGTVQGALDYGQGLASQEYGNAYQRLLGQNQLRYGRALTEDEQRFGRAQAQYGRELGENELQYGRTRDQYGRELSENQIQYGRARDQYGRELSENELNYGRWNQANQSNYARAYQQNADQANRMQAQRGGRFNELSSLAGLGLGATNTGTQLGANLGTNLAGNITSAGAAQAAGQVGASQAIAGGLQGVGNAATNYLAYSAMQNQLAQQQEQNRLLADIYRARR